jgi:Protein of unknown function (DUF664)/HipA-like C-terminal domain
MPRSVFNVVAHNRDDHARNSAHLWTSSGRLAPAYDLTHSMGPRPTHLGADPGENYLDVAGKGKDITRQDLAGRAKAAGLKPGAVEETIDSALAAVARWPELSISNGVDTEIAEQVTKRCRPLLTSIESVRVRCNTPRFLSPGRFLRVSSHLQQKRGPATHVGESVHWAGFNPSLRWILIHMIDEYARHCGHADLIRQAIDGAVGD